MSKYVVKETFYDAEDNKRLYVEGDIYPRDGYSPSAERVGSLFSGKNSKKKVFIKAVAGEVEEVAKNLEDLSVDELKEKAKKAGLENYSKLKKAELIELLSK